MTGPTTTDFAQYRFAVRQRGHAFVPGAAFAGLSGLGTEVAEIARAWDDLPADPYIADGKPYRYRRHAVLVYEPDGGRIRVLPHQDYLQSATNNPLFGGVRRRFAPVEWTAGTEQAVHGLVAVGVRHILGLTGRVRVHVHLVRIVGHAGQAGMPTPEGPHRDGFDYISIHLLALDVDHGGDTMISTDHRGSLGTSTLARPLDAIYVDDRRLKHYTSPITADGRTARRDVLLLSYEPYDGR